jgi:hypothetical protein
MPESREEKEVLAITGASCPFVNLARRPEHRLCAAQRTVASAERRRAREGKSTIFQTSFRPAAKEVNMGVVYPPCVGLDVHKKSVNVCIPASGRGKGCRPSGARHCATLAGCAEKEFLAMAAVGRCRRCNAGPDPVRAPAGLSRHLQNQRLHFGVNSRSARVRAILRDVELLRHEFTESAQDRLRFGDQGYFLQSLLAHLLRSSIRNRPASFDPTAMRASSWQRLSRAVRAGL